MQGVCIRSFVRTGGAVTGVSTDAGIIRGRRIVCTAGGWSRRLLSQLEVDLPLCMVRATVCLTAPLPPITRSTVWAAGYAFRQRADGRVILADGSEGDIDLSRDMFRQAPLFLPAFRSNWRQFRVHVGRAMVADPMRTFGSRRAYEPAPNARRIARAVRRIGAALPGIGDVVVESAWAGLIDSTPDALPVIDCPNQVPGLVVAAGFSGHGFGLAPAIGEMVADLVEDKQPSIDIKPFRLNRFREEPIDAPTAIL
jgi:glycine/D-amino acid oxidase-like deaminating enzyme